MLPTLRSDFVPVNTLEDGLAMLCQYGKPRLFSQGNGEWSCSIDMFVASQGVEFNIRSEFNHKSHVEAVNICWQRLHKALKDLGL